MIFSFLPQCCDASLYLELGQRCAAGIDCYHDLRPVGSVLWFSLPYRLGLPPASMIAVHLLLALLSVLLSVQALRSLLPAQDGRLSLLHTVLLAAGSVLAHAVFLLPVLFHSLSDGPAALFALIACWLLLWQRRASAWRFGLAGLLLGLAAWVRVYYLASLAVVMLLWLWWCWRDSSCRRMTVLFLLAAALPVLVQVAATYSRHGELSFIAPDINRKLSAAHFREPAIGYDTLVSNKPMFWQVRCHGKTLQYQSLPARPLADIACILNGRLQFYFGSYSPVTYLLDADYLQAVQQGVAPPVAGWLTQYGSDRHWSSLWFAANALALLAAAWLVRRQWPALDMAGRSALLLMLLCLGQGFPVAPEQRFIVAPMVMAWVLAVAFLVNGLYSRLCSRANT